MASAAQFQEISSLTELHPFAISSNKKGAWRILALDFDHNLVEAVSTLGNEHFYKYMQHWNIKKGRDKDHHYHWTSQLRTQVRYQACEPIERINPLLAQFRENGWTVVILTSRGEDMKEVTQQHLEDANLDISIEDVIFKTKDLATQQLLPKDGAISQWMQKQPQWDPSRAVEVIFSDDDVRYCEAVQRLPQRIANATVTCFHNIGTLPNPKLTQDQLNHLVLELGIYKHTQSIPGSPRDSLPLLLEIMKKSLKIETITEESVYEAVIDMIESSSSSPPKARSWFPFF